MLIRSSLTSNARYVMLQRRFHYWHNEWKVLENILQAFFIEITKVWKNSYILIKLLKLIFNIQSLLKLKRHY